MTIRKSGRLEKDPQDPQGPPERDGGVASEETAEVAESQTEE